MSRPRPDRITSRSRRRARRRGAHAPGAAATGATAVLIRPASSADDAEIGRLSALDERTLPHGERLLGVLDGRAVAALDVASGSAIADPFAPTVGIVKLLELRAAQVRS
jgi:hypothetical protein